MIESTAPADRALADRVIERLGPAPEETLRIGLSGTPGVGKSTFIEALGMRLVTAGRRLAVLAVDPSSARSGGSILGDKTRMERLSRSAAAFIRPSPSRASLGGVARRTREVIRLCEAAGFGTVIVETVGVGQSETMVADMTDIFLLLLGPGGGDDLQGVKRGIMERADFVLVNKADGDLAATATRTAADYAAALRLMRRRAEDPDGVPAAACVSAATGAGLAEAWERTEALAAWRRAAGVLTARRQDQARIWFRQEVEAGMIEAVKSAAGPDYAAAEAEAEAAVAAGTRSPTAAAAHLVARALGQSPA